MRQGKHTEVPGKNKKNFFWAIQLRIGWTRKLRYFCRKLTKVEILDNFRRPTMGDSQTQFSTINCTWSEVSAKKKLLPCHVRSRHKVSFNIVNFLTSYFHYIFHRHFWRNFPRFLTHPIMAKNHIFIFSVYLSMFALPHPPEIHFRPFFDFIWFFKEWCSFRPLNPMLIT